MRQILTQMAESNDPEEQKCVFCMLVENLYPDKIAPALYEDSGLSSGTLEEVTLTEGVSRRAAVKTILKKLVKYQKQKGPGRECIDALARALPETCGYLLPVLRNTAIEDLKQCSCVIGQTIGTGKSEVKVRKMPHRPDDLLDVSDLLPYPTQSSYIPDDTVNNNTDLTAQFESHGILTGPGIPEASGVQSDYEVQGFETAVQGCLAKGQGYEEYIRQEEIHESQGQLSQTKQENIAKVVSEIKRSIEPDKDTFEIKGQAASQGHRVVKYVAPPGTVRIGPGKQHRTIVALCGEMDVLISDGLWDEFLQYTQQLKDNHPDDVDVQLNILHHTIFTHCVQNTVSSETHELLRQSKELIPRSTCPQYFEIDYLGMLSKVLRKDKQYGMVQCCINCIYQKSKLLLPEKIVTLAKHRDAEYLIHRFQNKFLTNSIPENIFRQIEEGFLNCIEQSTRVREFFRESKITVKYADDCYVSGRRCHIHLALLYLRCCVTGEGITEAFDVSSSDIRKAEQSLNKVLEEWEGISSRTKSKYLLAMSDLSLRRKDYGTALGHAKEALQICESKNHKYMSHWALRRISYLQNKATVGAGLTAP